MLACIVASKPVSPIPIRTLAIRLSPNTALSPSASGASAAPMATAHPPTPLLNTSTRTERPSIVKIPVMSGEPAGGRVRLLGRQRQTSMARSTRWQMGLTQISHRCPSEGPSRIDPGPAQSEEQLRVEYALTESANGKNQQHGYGHTRDQKPDLHCQLDARNVDAHKHTVTRHPPDPRRDIGHQTVQIARDSHHDNRWGQSTSIVSVTPQIKPPSGPKAFLVNE